MIETDRLVVLRGEPNWTTLPSESGAGQKIARCPSCLVALYSIYQLSSIRAELLRIVRVGTLDQPDLLPPDVHIWTSEKQPWIVLSDKVPAVDKGEYELEQVWTTKGLQRRDKVLQESQTREGDGTSVP